MIIPELWAALLDDDSVDFDYSAMYELQDEMDIASLRNMYFDYWISLDKPEEWMENVHRALDKIELSLMRKKKQLKVRKNFVSFQTNFLM